MRGLSDDRAVRGGASRTRRSRGVVVEDARDAVTSDTTVRRASARSTDAPDVGARRTSSRGMDAPDASVREADGRRASARSATTRGTGDRDVATRSSDTREQEVHARPAVFTEKAPKTTLADKISSARLSKAGLPRLSAPSFELGPVPMPIVLVVLAALVVAIVASPARGYYKAWREAGTLRAEYEALEEQQAELNAEIERLKSPEGEEEEARSRGYVYPDEEALVVTNVKDQEVADPVQVDEAVEEHERNLPWYVRVLDFVLGYSRG